MNQLMDKYKQLAAAPIEDAKSLPFAIYHDQEVFDLEAQSIFRNEWVFICCEQEIKEKGDYYAFDLVGESISIIHGKDGVFRALSNNCRHRGTPILDQGFGKINKVMSCPYHAWSYDDQGASKGVPFPGEIKIEKKEHCLPEFNLQSFMGLLFINLSENPTPLKDRLEGLEDYMAVFESQRFQSATSGNVEVWQANWKLAMENAMESYHLFRVHKSTLETMTPTKRAFYVAGSSEWTLTAGLMSDHAIGTTSKVVKWLKGDYPEVYNHYLLVSLPPSFVGIMTCDSFDWLQVMPINKETSLIRSASIAETDHINSDKATKDFVESFFAEDKMICERVQKGMYSQCGAGGKLVEMERVVSDFHQFLSSRLFETRKENIFIDEKASMFKQS